MALRLIIEDEEGATTIVPLGEEEVTIGREPGNTIQLTEQNVSRQHARLTQGSEGWVIEDLDSYNGVKVNGVLVEGSVSLNEGDVVQIGDYHLALSNNVEQTTLNLDRPTQAANEPNNRVMPSVDLPRISATEAAALATPSFTPAVNDAGRDGRDEREGGGSRGLLLGLGLIALLGLGFVAYRFMGTGDPQRPANDTNKNLPAVGPEDPKDAPPKTVVTPEPKPVDPPPEVPPPDPTGVAVDASAGETPPPVDPPTKKVVKPVTPKVPKPVDPKKPDEPKGDPVALLDDARKASLAGNATQAYELARKSYEIDKNGQALQLMGVSACKMGDNAKAKSVYKKLEPSRQSQLKTMCQEKGIMLE